MCLEPDGQGVSFHRHLSFKASSVSQTVCWQVQIDFEINHSVWQRPKDRGLKRHQPEPNIQTAAFTVRIVAVFAHVISPLHRDALESEFAPSVVFQPLGASDYLEMARDFDTVFIRDVPMLTLTLKDQARRFTTLIDNFYDSKVSIEDLKL